MWNALEYPIIETGFPHLEGYWWVYVPFNIAEALAWLAIACFIFVRYLRHRRTWYELQYCASFVLFAVTDLVEVYGTTPWLLGLKAACLLAILQGRKLVIGYYHRARF